MISLLIYMVTVIHLKGFVGFSGLVRHNHIDVEVVYLLVKLFTLFLTANANYFAIVMHVFNYFWRNIFDLENGPDSDVIGTYG